MTTQRDEELVARLRGSLSYPPRLHAADRIEVLAAELKAVLDREAETQRRHDARMDAKDAELTEAKNEAAALRAENEKLRADLSAFCCAVAANYARSLGLPDGHLHPTHYDILAKVGARMDDFTRAALHEKENTDE